MSEITLDMSIKNIIEQYPETLPVFVSFGFRNFEDPLILDKLGQFLKLGTLLRYSKIDWTTFIKRCCESIEDYPINGSINATEDVISAKPTLLALLPCGLKVSLDRAIQKFAEQSILNDKPFSYLAEGNVNHELSYYPYIDSVESVDELPDLILSADLNAFFHHRFLKRFVFTDNFKCVSDQMNSRLTDAKYADPRGYFTMFSANILVVVHVKDTTNAAPAPVSWEDFLSPRYRKSIVMRGQDDFFCSGVLVPFFKLFGLDAISKLASSVCGGMHPSQMVKLIDSPSKEIPPFYIMPWFFAKKIKQTDRIEIVFPQEGAFVSPVQLLVKKTKVESLTSISEFLMSQELHQHCADNYFPSPHLLVNDIIPRDKNIFWIGWDFIYNNDLEEIKKSIGEIFTTRYLKTGGSTCD
jgi:ABC-type Fe3+ transport system substrate-binding protein